MVKVEASPKELKVMQFTPKIIMEMMQTGKLWTLTVKPKKETTK